MLEKNNVKFKPLVQGSGEVQEGRRRLGMQRGGGLLRSAGRKQLLQLRPRCPKKLFSLRRYVSNCLFFPQRIARPISHTPTGTGRCAASFPTRFAEMTGGGGGRGEKLVAGFRMFICPTVLAFGLVQERGSSRALPRARQGEEGRLRLPSHPQLPQLLQRGQRVIF